jgi:hypothetical protein
VGGRDHPARLAGLPALWLDPTRGMEDQGMTLVWIAITGFTFFVGQPDWAELDTSGIDWIVYQIEVTGNE